MRGSIAQPWSKTPSRTKGTSRNLGDLAFGRAVIHVAGPHGEGDEPKPMMNEREKSDSAVVAVKSTNEAGRPAEEWMEPRAGAKGNVGRSITLRTQCRAGVSHALGHIRYALQFAAKPSNTRGGSRMRESRTSGFVRGAHSNMCPYRDRTVLHSKGQHTHSEELVVDLCSFADTLSQVRTIVDSDS